MLYNKLLFNYARGLSPFRLKINPPAPGYGDDTIRLDYPLRDEMEKDAIARFVCRDINVRRLF